MVKILVEEETLREILTHSSQHLVVKATRLINCKKIKFIFATKEKIIFEVAGDSGEYEVWYDNDIGMVDSCTCDWNEKTKGLCSHMLAVLFYIYDGGQKFIDNIKQKLI